MKRAKLLKNVEIENDLIPAGTIVNVETEYNDEPKTIDCYIGDKDKPDAMFWTFADEVEEVK